MLKIQSKMSMSYRQLSSRPSNQIYRIPSPVRNGEKLYMDKKTADVTFTFESTDAEQPSAVRIGAHRILLANNSDVFKEMFYGEDEPIDFDGEIAMADVSQEVFKDFLQFFYLSEVKLHADIISGLMYLGQKYKVMQCVEMCVQFLKDIATADNILIAIGLAVQYNHADLLKFCEQFIILNTDAVLASDGFLECELQTLAYVINANLLACSEIKLFESCMEWVKAKSKQTILTKEIVDEHLGDLFYEIRFGAISIQELCNLAMKYDLVLSKDFKTITKLIVLPNFQPAKFNTRPRQVKWFEDSCIMECNDIANHRERDFEHTCNDDAFDKSNLKRKNPTIILTNKRLRLISSACNEMHPDSCSSDEDMEFASETGNERQLKIVSRPSKK